MITVEEAEALDDELLEAFTHLVPQLSRTAPPPTGADLAEMLDAPGTHILVARDEGAIVGTLTLVVFRLPTGVRAWIEDVVVDAAARGRGVGEALTRRAVEVAAGAGARTIDLTSRPTREAANRLYRRAGFEPRDTNVWRFELETRDPGT